MILTPSSSARALPESPPRSALAAAGKRIVLIEAADHIGGRCVTDSRTFGLPFDRGAHWIHLPDSNPVAKFAPGHGIEIYPAPRSQKVRIGLRYAREKELEDFLAVQVRATRAIDDAARKADVAAASALPTDLGDWQPTAEFVLGPFAYGQDLAKLSAADFASAAERPSDAFCRQGFGSLLAARAAGVAAELSAPATSIEIDRTVTVQTPKGTITARTGIITMSTAVLASGRIQFIPELPQRLTAAFHSLPLGSYDHIALQFSGNPLGLDSDDLVFEKSADTHTAAILGNVSGTQLCLIDVGWHIRPIADRTRRGRDGRFRRQLARQALWRADQKVDHACRRHAMEYRGAHARRHVGRRAGRPLCACRAGRAGARCRVVRRRGRPRNAVGHGRAAPGSPASAPPTRCCGDSPENASRQRKIADGRASAKESAARFDGQ